MAKEKKKREFLSSFSICFIVVIIATLLTWVIPAGGYQTIQYSSDSNSFIISSADYDEEAGTGSQEKLPATQATLDKLNVEASLESFLNGSISKPIAIPDTYQELQPAHQGIAEFLASPINGVLEAFDIVLFMMMLGGAIGVINCIGSFNSGIAALSKVCKGKEQIVIIVITVAIAFLGTIEGFCEETIALYPVLIPIFVSAGYDGLTVAASIYMGSTIGCMFSTVNPFSVGLGSYAAGTSFVNGMVIRLIGLVLGTVITVLYILRYAKKVKEDPSKSLVPGNFELLAKKYSVDGNNEFAAFTWKSKLTLVVFLLTFATMIFGIVKLGWWFTELAELFLFAGILIGVIGGLNEKEIADEFIAGAADLTGVILVIGVARAVTIIMDSGKISGTILYALSQAVAHLSPALFVVMLLFVFIVLGFFINSSTGLAVLSIPIIAPLADVVGISREVIVSAYIYGLGIITFISPTGTVLPSLDMVHIGFNKWVKFCMPLLGILTVFAAALLIVELKIS